MARKQPDAVRITSAAQGHSVDLGHRQRRYMISMGIRTACFVLAVLSIGHWWMWVLLAASFVLPYVAVVMANTGATTDPGGPEPVVPRPKGALEEPRHDEP
ncbi:MAG: DUF3099 domain-containing protein [Nocardioidaceae bacterium]